MIWMITLYLEAFFWKVSENKKIFYLKKYDRMVGHIMREEMMMFRLYSVVSLMADTAAAVKTPKVTRKVLKTSCKKKKKAAEKRTANK